MAKLSAHSGIWGHRGHWLATVGVVLGQLVFVALAAAVGSALGNSLSAAALEAIGIVISLIPALIWLVFFYSQDRFEPEPKEFVLEVFVLGVLVAGALGIPLVRDVFQLSHWLDATIWTHLFGSILVVGFVQQFLIFAAVRYSIYESEDFRRAGRRDRLCYCRGAGLRHRARISSYVTGHGGVSLGVGTIRVTVDALAYASIGGVMGYMLGQAKFEHRPFYYLPAGLILVAVLDGVFFWLQDLVDVRAASASSPLWLVVAVVVAVVLLGVVLALVRRDNAETLALQRARRQRRRWNDGHREPALWGETFVTPAQPRPGRSGPRSSARSADLCAGHDCGVAAQGQRAAAHGQLQQPRRRGSLAYPASWFMATTRPTPAGGRALLDVYDPQSGRHFPAQFQIQRRTVPAGSSLAQQRAVTADERDLTLAGLSRAFKPRGDARRAAGDPGRLRLCRRPACRRRSRYPADRGPGHR